MADTGPESTVEDKENHQIKAEDIKKEKDKDKDDEIFSVDKPTKCISSRKLIEINAQVQFIDFEGRSDGESLLKILSQLRPRRVVVVRGSEANAKHIAQHCEKNIGARVFVPTRGEVTYSFIALKKIVLVKT